MAEERTATKAFFGCALTSVGVLLTLLSGSCVGLFTVSGAVKDPFFTSMFVAAIGVLILGIILVVVGVVIGRGSGMPEGE